MTTKGLIKAAKEQFRHVVQREFWGEYNEQEQIEMGLGIIISQFFEWTGDYILRTFFYALEDANFHTEAHQVIGMLDKLGFPTPGEQ